MARWVATADSPWRTRQASSRGGQHSSISAAPHGFSTTASRLPKAHLCEIPIANSAINEGRSPPFGLISRNSPRPALNVVMLSNARHGRISPVGPEPGSRAARELQTRSACWRQLAAVQYIPVGILRLKRIRMLGCPERALGACRADHANRHHRRNNGSPESNHTRSPKDFCSRAEHSR